MVAHNGSVQGSDTRQFNPRDFGSDSNVTGITNSFSTGYQYYTQGYSMTDDLPFVETNVLQSGLCAQDKWTVSDKLDLALGLCADVPFFVTSLQSNDKVVAETYRDDIKTDVSKCPSAKPQFSP